MRAALLRSELLEDSIRKAGLAAYFEILQPAVLGGLENREADGQSQWAQDVAATAGQVRPPLAIELQLIPSLGLESL